MVLKRFSPVGALVAMVQGVPGSPEGAEEQVVRLVIAGLVPGVRQNLISGHRGHGGLDPRGLQLVRFVLLVDRCSPLAPGGEGPTWVAERYPLASTRTWLAEPLPRSETLTRKKLCS